MVCLWLPRGPWMAAVVLTLMVLSSSVALVRDPGPRFLQQVKSECHYSNGMEHVRYLQRHIYNQEEHLRFDSEVGKYQAVTELGQIQAEYWNSQKGFLEQKRAKVHTFCRFNYAIVEILTVQQRDEPQVTVYPTKTKPLEHHNLLVCSVRGFYPGQIEVRWFRNGQEEKTRVVTTGLIWNGDWTFQTLVMLETVPQSGEVYTCQVEHPSLSSPATVEWRAQSSSARNKMLSGVGGFMLGLLFLGLGLFIYFRNQKDSLDSSRQTLPLAPNCSDHSLVGFLVPLALVSHSHQIEVPSHGHPQALLSTHGCDAAVRSGKEFL
ncbi:H-2 class II histocompatibility antigen, I-A beta chain [Microtus ochrogaster]|uniref:H-2 class II histocompatibility antigen, I-A beta chain n=1 Tax=Microtus ochrogaster TaxID=79684 RepID=A0A8J6FYK3_MICOH|nr:H-2 class II histocompatibility antigen, I-A beta chain [Microtus ochrogaster]